MERLFPCSSVWFLSFGFQENAEDSLLLTFRDDI